MLSLLASVPLVPSTLASDVRLSNFFLFIVYVSWISLPVSPTLPFPGLWRPVFTGFSLLVSQSGSRRLVVSGCPDIFLYSSPFICFLLWLVVTAVRMSSLCSHLFPIMFLLPFFSGSMYLSHNSSVFNHQSASAVVSDSFACSPLCLSSITCF